MIFFARLSFYTVLPYRVTIQLDTWNQNLKRIRLYGLYHKLKIMNILRRDLGRALLLIIKSISKC